MDGWLEMNAPAQTAVLFKELRGALDSVLQERIGMPQVDIHRVIMSVELRSKEESNSNE